MEEAPRGLRSLGQSLKQPTRYYSVQPIIDFYAAQHHQNAFQANRNSNGRHRHQAIASTGRGSQRGPRRLSRCWTTTDTTYDIASKTCTGDGRAAVDHYGVAGRCVYHSFLDDGRFSGCERCATISDGRRRGLDLGRTAADDKCTTCRCVVDCRLLDDS